MRRKGRHYLVAGTGVARSKAFLHRVAAASGGSPRLVAQRYRNMTAAIAVALKKALANIEKRYLALCVNAPEG